MSTYVMSDLHGCFDDFQAMLEKIRFSDNDRLIIAGDLIERGPQNYEMLRWIEQCPENIILLRGNHEEEFTQNIARTNQVCREPDRDPEDPNTALAVYHTLSGQYRFFDYYSSIRGLLKDHSVSINDLKDCGAVFRYWGEADSRMTCMRLEDETFVYI